MRIIPELTGRAQRIMDCVFRIALLVMAAIAFHALSPGGTAREPGAHHAQDLGVPPAADHVSRSLQ